MDESKQTIMIFSGGEVVSSSDVRRGLKDVAASVAGKVSEVGMTTLQENMRRFLHSLSVILTVPPEETGGLTLDTVEVSAQIDSKGNIGITGVAGAELAAHGGIKLILKRKG
ncbi:MAG: hypothetical protein ACLQVJ_23755 [Syntrophobacteraceae bacterium]